MKTRSQILVVEDKAITAEDLKETLEALGYDVAGVATSGEVALEFIAKTPLDLVLMDIVLDGKMDGIEAAQTIHDQFHIPVIYLTSYTNKNILERAKVTTPFGYLVKPFQEKELQATIEIALYKSQKERQIISANTIQINTLYALEPWQDLLEKIKQLLALPNPKHKTKYPPDIKKVEQILAEILYVNAEARDSILIFDADSNITLPLKISVQDLEAFIPNNRLMRIHRSYLINPEKVLCITKKSVHDYEFWLCDRAHKTATVPIGRSYLERLFEQHPLWFKQKN